jgi:hypothetical protein
MDGVSSFATETESLTVRTNHSTTCIRWSGISKIAETADHAFLYISSTEAHVVPRRAFASVRDFEAFIDRAIKYHESAIGQHV